MNVTGRPRFDSTTYALHAAREVIGGGLADIQREFKRIKANSVADQQDVLMSRRELFASILEMMGRTLFDGLVEFRRHTAPEANGLEFYFWPGYESIVDRGHRASLLWNLDGADIHCGTGFRHTREGTHKTGLASPSAFWFSKVLTTVGDEHLGKVFHPGSTHKWMSPKGLRAVSESGPKRVSALRIGRSSSKDNVSTSFNVGILEVDLPADQWRNWGPLVATELNNSRHVSSDDGGDVGRWPTPVKEGAEDSYESHLREWAYSIWLSATLGEELPQEWLRDYALAAQGLGFDQLAAAIQESARDSARSRSQAGWQQWYTLRLEGTESTDGSTFEALGTAMLFVSELLHPAFVYQATSFANQVYLRMRDFEREGIIARLSRTAGRAELVGAFSHEVGKLTQQLEDWLIPVEEAAHVGGRRPRRWLDSTLALEGPSDIVAKTDGWKLVPIPELYEGLSTILAIWGGSKNWPRLYGIDRTDRVDLADLLFAIAKAARPAAAARRWINEGAWQSLGQAVRLREQFKVFSTSALASVTPPKVTGERLIAILEGNSGERKMAGFFVRAAAALLVNALYHARDESEVDLEIDVRDTFVRFVILNSLRPALARAKDPEFPVGSRAVAEYCIQEVGGRVRTFPDGGTDPCITDFSIPRDVVVHESGTRGVCRWLSPL